MVQIEVFATLAQSVAGATVIAQQQANDWLKHHTDLALGDVHVETQVIREAAEIIWCVISITYHVKDQAALVLDDTILEV